MLGVVFYGLVLAGGALLLEWSRRLLLSERGKDINILTRQQQYLAQRTRETVAHIRRLEEQETAASDIFAVLKRAASSLSTGNILKMVRTDLRAIGSIHASFKRSSARRPSALGVVAYRLYSDSPRRLSLQFENIPEELRPVPGIFAAQLNICLEISSLYRYYQKLSVFDPLTGTANKRYFLEKYESEFTRADRRQLPLSLIMLDIDDFKKCNDTYGHIGGDIVLKEVAGAIKKTIRGVDTLARYGGEEFCVILPGTELKNAVRAAERIREKIAQLRIKIFEEPPVSMTVSLGAASFPRNALSAPELLEVADGCLYEAKLGGKNRIHYESGAALPHESQKSK